MILVIEENIFEYEKYTYMVKNLQKDTQETSNSDNLFQNRGKETKWLG